MNGFLAAAAVAAPSLFASAPLVLLAAACVLKFSIVLSLLGRALGGRALPATVVGAVALLLAAFVLTPVAEKALVDPRGGTEPVREFLERRVTPEARRELLELQRGLRPPAERERVGEKDVMVLAPAFALAELKSAFRIGFFLLLPFLVIDLLIGVVLLALGMHTIEARVIALPCKLLLFVAVDGWTLLTRGLLLGYGA